MRGPLYDDFRICDRVSGDVIYNVTPKSGHSFEAEIFSRENGFNEPIASGKTLTEIYKNMASTVEA
jgi:hypothetical protein